MLKDRYSYAAIFSYDPDGISIDFPDLPGCCPCAGPGDTDTALKNAKEALGLHLWGMEKDKDEIPEPTPIAKITLKNGRVPILIDVSMPPIRKRLHNRFVKRKCPYTENEHLAQ